MLGHLVSNMPAQPVQPIRLFTWLKHVLSRWLAA